MSLEASVGFAQQLVDEGADILDLGAVKAGPGIEVSEEDESLRLLPLVEAIANRVDVPLSVETSNPRIATDAMEAGAAILNDVSGLADPGLLDACKITGAALVLMHHGGQIRGRPRHPEYDDVVIEVKDHLLELCKRAESSGIESDSLVIDPGLDFGKNTFHSLELMRRLHELIATQRHVLVAASRKDVIGETLGLPPGERLEGSVALAVVAAMAGARIVRVHDVQATLRAVSMADAVRGILAPIAPVRGLWD